MTKWEGKTRGGLIGYKIFVFFIKTFGIGFAYFFLYFVAWYFVFFSRVAYRSIYYYFHHVLKYNAFKSFHLTYFNFCTLGKTLVDKVAVLSGMKSKFTFNFDGEHYLRQMVTDGTGGILINAHVGNWEIAGQLLERLNTKIHVLMFDAERQQISQYLNDVMTEKDMQVIIIKEDMSHLNEIKEALSKKEIIAMNGDRFIEGNKVYKVNFLGKEALFPAGPFSIASKFDVPVTFAFAMKESRTHYHFFATPPEKVKAYKTLAERERNTREMVEKYAQELEKKVKSYPLQWFNYYQFWSN
jgi:predicted LPLAT superfamily acyltransferase